MKTKTIIVTLIFSVLGISNAFTQNGEYITVRDFNTWSSIGLEYKFSPNWDIALEEQMRLKNNSSEVDQYFTELSINHDFGEHIFGGIGFRYIRENDNEGKIQGYENHIRFDFNLGYQHKINDFELKYRLRFQTKNELGISSEEGDYANNHLRFKTSVGYNIHNWKLDPVLSAEIFRHYEKGEINGFDKFRFSLGTSYKIKKIGKIGVSYLIEKELNTTYPFTTHIINLNYLYTFKNKKK